MPTGLSGQYRDLTLPLGHGALPPHKVGDVENERHAMAASQHIALTQQDRQYLRTLMPAQEGYPHGTGISSGTEACSHGYRTEMSFVIAAS
jgi:hypothetical protein